MANEGEWLKVDGDVAYASEYNRLARAPQFIAAGSTWEIGSSTDYQVLGSFLLPGGSYVGSYWGGIEFDFYTSFAEGAYVRLRLSGGTTNDALFAVSGDMEAGAGNTQGYIKAFLGHHYRDDCNAGFIGGACRVGSNSVGTFYWQRKNTVFDFAGSDFVVFMDMFHNKAGPGSMGIAYNLRAWRGNY